ncbi:tail protein [Elstera cyanobacteriorum]|nr:putative phage tail protein [Elstera cyanobacteriorum]GFZ80693.1 tail protein [Elstera cyanobacteriorum]
MAAPIVPALPEELLVPCGATDEEYRQMMADLLPLGPVWPRRRDSTLQKLLLAFGAELARAHNRGCDLAREAVPSDSVELLPDLERVTGLPDECEPPGESTIEARQRRVVAKLNHRGGQSIQVYKDLARDSFGISLCVREFRPFRAGPDRPSIDPVYAPGAVNAQSAGGAAPTGFVVGRRLQSEFYGHAGAPLSNNDWRFVWSVCLCDPASAPPGAQEIKFRAGAKPHPAQIGALGRAGDPLRIYEDNLVWLLCLINRNKPAHTLLLWNVLCPDLMDRFKNA